MSKTTKISELKAEKLSLDEKEVLAGWEEVYKKGHLTLWILLALKHGPKHMAEIKRFITAYTNGTLSADDKSMYRALRRYDEANLVKYRVTPSKNGPDLKIYQLSNFGRSVLEAFVRRNIKSIFFKHHVKELLE